MKLMLSKNRDQKRAFTLVELLVVIAIIGILVALLLPAVQSVREAARRCSCRINLKQVGLATLLYHDTQGHLPPPSAGNTYENYGSTLVFLLPYLEDSALYDTYNFEEVITHDDNLPTTTTTISTYICPSMAPPTYVGIDDAQGLGYGSYLISTRTAFLKYAIPDGAFDTYDTDKGYGLALNDITDGTSHTILMGEINYAFEDHPIDPHRMPTIDSSDSSSSTSKIGGFAWAEGYWARGWGHMTASLPIFFNNNKEKGNPNSYRSFRSDHPGGVNFVMLDGSVRFLTDDSDPDLRSALVTREGEEIVED